MREIPYKIPDKILRPRGDIYLCFFFCNPLDFRVHLNILDVNHLQLRQPILASILIKSRSDDKMATRILLDPIYYEEQYSVLHWTNMDTVAQTLRLMLCYQWNTFAVNLSSLLGQWGLAYTLAIRLGS